MKLDEQELQELREKNALLKKTNQSLDKQLEQKINQSIDIEDIDKQLEQITVETTQETLGPIAKQAATTTDPNKIEQKLKNMNDAYNQQMGSGIKKSRRKSRIRISER